MVLPKTKKQLYRISAYRKQFKIEKECLNAVCKFMGKILNPKNIYLHDLIEFRTPKNQFKIKTLAFHIYESLFPRPN